MFDITLDSSSNEIKSYISQVQCEYNKRLCLRPICIEVTCLHLTLDGAHLVAGDSIGNLYVYKVEGIASDTDLELSADVSYQNAHQGSVLYLTPVTHLSTRLFSSGADRRIVLWDKFSQSWSGTHERDILFMSYVENFLWVVDSINITQIAFSNKTDNRIRVFPINTDIEKCYLVFSLKMYQMLIFSSNGSIHYWDIMKNEAMISLEYQDITAVCVVESKLTALSSVTNGIFIVNIDNENVHSLLGSEGVWNALGIVDGDVLISVGCDSAGPCAKFWNTASMGLIYRLELLSAPLLIAASTDDENFFLLLEGRNLLKIKQKEKLIEKSIHSSSKINDFALMNNEIVRVEDNSIILSNHQLKEKSFSQPMSSDASIFPNSMLSDKTISVQNRNQKESCVIKSIKFQDNRLLFCYGNKVAMVDLMINEDKIVELFFGNFNYKFVDFGEGDLVLASGGDGEFSELIVFHLTENTHKYLRDDIEGNIYEAKLINMSVIYVKDDQIVICAIDTNNEQMHYTFARNQLKFCCDHSKTQIYCVGNNEIIDYISIKKSIHENFCVFQGISSSFSIQTNNVQYQLSKNRAYVSSIAINASGLFLIIIKEDALQFWNIRDEILIWEHKLNSFKDSKVRVSQQYIYVSLSSEIIIAKDPTYVTFSGLSLMKSQNSVSLTQRNYEQIMILGPNSSSLYFLGVINDIIKKKDYHESYDSRIYKFAAFPHCLNMLHVFTLFQNAALIKKAFAHNCAFLRMVNGSSPLTIGLSTNNKQIIEVLVKKIAQMSQKNPKIITRIEEDLPKLNIASPPSLSNIYELAFQRITQPGLKNYGNLLIQSGMLITSDSYVIEEQKFLVPKSEKRFDEVNLVYRVSTFRLNLSLGNIECIRFLESLCECSDNDVFRTQIVKSIVIYKWNQVKWYVISYNIVYAIFASVTMYYVAVTVKFSFIWHILIFLFNSLLMFYEALQLSVGSKTYLKNLWNVLDLLRIVNVYFFLYLKFLYFYPSINLEDEYNKSLYKLTVMGVVLLSLLKGLSFFECISKTRSMIKVLTDVIKDSASFIVLFVCTTLTFTFLFMVLNSDLTLFKALTTSHSINFGSFDTDGYDFLQLLCFHLATLVNPLLMVNLLVSIMNDTFSNLNENNDTEDIKALAELIIEHESVIIWGFNRGHKQFLQSCSPEINNLPSDRRGYKLNKLIKELDSIEESVKSVASECKNRYEKLINVVSKIRKEEIDFFKRLNKDEGEFRSKIEERKIINVS